MDRAQSQLPRIAISMGDPCGISPEVVAAALTDRRVREAMLPIVFGDRGALVDAAASRGVQLQFADGELVETTRLETAACVPGHPRDGGREAGAASLAYVDAAIDAVLAGQCDALCTAPLSKHRVSLAHAGFQGHTEHLAERFQTRTAMMMAGPRLRVVLATNHLALAEVSRRLTQEQLAFVIQITHQALAQQFGISRPRIAVCGLNPHAGDGGIFGDEEARIVTPAIDLSRAAGLDATGPHAADGLFPRAVRGDFDAVIALYHDQGLIPAKLLDFRETVNVTLGLARPRTSPDHGTADDLAGQGKADAEPMISALLLAAKLARNS